MRAPAPDEVGGTGRLVRDRRRSALATVVTIAAIAFLCEAAIMTMTYVLDMRGLAGVLVDAGLLTVLLTPALYLLVYRPLDHDLQALLVSEAALCERTEALHRLSVTDGLTGLYNRRGFFAAVDAHLAKTGAREGRLFLLFADLDNLKTINDGRGHEAGDRALARAAETLREALGPSDIIGRMGGDEFAALLVGRDGADAGEIALAALQARIAAVNGRTGLGFELSVSAGAVHWDPSEGATVDEMLLLADACMYRQKDARREAAGAKRRVPRLRPTGDD